MIVRTVVMPVLALIGIILAGWSVHYHARPVPVSATLAEPAQTRLPAAVTGSGIVEAASENIAVGSPLAGIAVEVSARVGMAVTAGDVLFRLDDRALRSQLAVQEAQLAVARSQLDRLGRLPRTEELPPAEARVATARAAFEDASAAARLYDGLADPEAASVDERDRRRFAVEKARAQLAEATSTLDLLKAGAWQADVAIQQAQVASIAAQIGATRTDLDRLVVRAPIAGTVLQVRIRTGEFVPMAPGASLVMLGDTGTMHVRTDFDEYDAWRVDTGAEAEAYVRGNRALRTRLRFVRCEPVVIPKKNLTNEATERVDTRVLQVVFAVEDRNLRLHVGQLMDVFLAVGTQGTGP